MAQFGCCLPMASFVAQMKANDAQHGDILEQLKNGLSIVHQNGYDFAELTVGTLANLSDDDFEKAKNIIESAGIKVPVFNSFIPPSIPLTGPSVSVQQIEEYIGKAIMRISEIGGLYIIFGSGSARRVPEGFPKNQAKEQIMEFLKLCEHYAAKYGVFIAVEPLNKKETNIINTVEEALNLVLDANLPHIKVLADSYHMFLEQESFDIIYRAAKQLVHVHIADKDRFYPGQSVQDGVDFKSFFKVLKSIGYNGGISAECRFDDFPSQSARSLSYVKELWESVH